MLQEFLLLVEWSIKFVVDSRSFLKRKNAIEEGWLVTQRYLSAAPFCRVTAINNDAAIPSKSLNACTVLPSSLERAKRTLFYCCSSSSNLSHKRVTFWFLGGLVYCTFGLIEREPHVGDVLKKNQIILPDFNGTEGGMVWLHYSFIRRK